MSIGDKIIILLGSFLLLNIIVLFGTVIVESYGRINNFFRKLLKVSQKEEKYLTDKEWEHRITNFFLVFMLANTQLVFTIIFWTTKTHYIQFIFITLLFIVFFLIGIWWSNRHYRISQHFSYYAEKVLPRELASIEERNKVMASAIIELEKKLKKCKNKECSRFSSKDGLSISEVIAHPQFISGALWAAKLPRKKGCAIFWRQGTDGEIGGWGPKAYYHIHGDGYPNVHIQDLNYKWTLVSPDIIKAEGSNR